MMRKMTDDNTDVQLESLRAILQDMGSVVTAFSGGVDSALVSVAAHGELGRNALAVTAVSPALAGRELDGSRRTGPAVRHSPIGLSAPTKWSARATSKTLPGGAISARPSLYTHLTALAQSEGYAWVANGANTDDQGDYRPGMEAAAEHQARSPLLEAGLDKAAVRAIARRLDIPVWDKPAQPCLSSRVPYGTPVTVETLSKIERAEDFLRGLGMREVRARHHDKLCRVEASESDMEIAFRRREEIVAGLKKIGYLWVSLDLAPLRSGSLNDVLKR